MYLHQQLIDNLLLHNKSKLCNLQSRYTCNIIRAKDTVNEWCNYTLMPNTITKLRYQYAYKICKISYLYKQTRWCYIKGISYCTIPILNNVAIYGHAKLFDLCLKYTSPNNMTILYAAESFNIEMFEKCINLGLQPTNEIMNNAIYGDKEISIVKMCLKHGVIPNLHSIECAISAKNVKAFKLFLDQGIKPDQDIIKYIFMYDVLELFNEYL